MVFYLNEIHASKIVHTVTFNSHIVLRCEEILGLKAKSYFFIKYYLPLGLVQVT